MADTASNGSIIEHTDTRDAGERRLNELGYKQELRHEMTLFKTVAISFSTMTLFIGITPLFGSSLMYTGPVAMVWGWVVVSFFTGFVAVAMAEICSSFSVIGGAIIVVMLPLVAKTTQTASYVFKYFDMSPSTGIHSKPYVVILAFLVSQYSLYGYDAVAHLTEETKDADINGPIAILSSLGIIFVFGWAYILALMFSIQNFTYLYDKSNETAGAFVPAKILYDAFYGRFHSGTSAIIILFIIWGSFFWWSFSYN